MEKTIKINLRRPFFLFSMFLVIFLISNHNIEGMFVNPEREEGGNHGFIKKETIEKADLICIGKLKEIIMEKGNVVLSHTTYPKKINQDTIQIELYSEYPELRQKITIKGDWCIAKILVDEIIKGTTSEREIKIRYFFPLTDPYAAYLDIFTPNLSYLLFLKKETQGLYSLIRHSNSFIEFGLPPIPSNLSEIKDQKEKIKAVLLQALEKGDRRSKDGILYTLSQLDINSEELISAYKELTKKAKPEIKDIVISKRISLGDTSALEDIVALSISDAYSEIEFSYVKFGMIKFAEPKYIPIFLKLLDSKNSSLKEGAIIALSEIKDKSVIPYFIKMLDDKDSSVRYRAVFGLAKVTGKYDEWAPSVALFEKDEKQYIQRWQKWWEEEGQMKYKLPSN